RGLQLSAAGEADAALGGRVFPEPGHRGRRGVPRVSRHELGIHDRLRAVRTGARDRPGGRQVRLRDRHPRACGDPDRSRAAVPGVGCLTMSGTARMLRNPLWLTVTVVLIWVIGTFLILPNVTLLGQVFADDTGTLTLRAFERLFSSERAVESLWNSVLLAAILSVTVNVVGIFLVLVTRFYAIRGARFLWLGYASTLVCGGIVLVFGYKQVYGPTGAVTRLVQQIFPDLDPNWFSGMFAVVVVMTFASTGNHLLFLAAAIAKIDLQTIEAARMM